MLKLMGKKIFTIVRSKKCLSKPVGTIGLCLSIPKVNMLIKVFNPLKTRNAKTGAMAYIEDPYEMLHNAQFAEAK